MIRPLSRLWLATLLFAAPAWARADPAGVPATQPQTPDAPVGDDAPDLAVPDGPPPAATIPPMPPALPGTLHLRGDGRHHTADCAGRNVLIEGSNSTYRLTGGCRSVTVQGNRDAIDASLAARARIAIAGDHVRLTWRLSGAGVRPIISITGTDSRVSP